MLSDSTKLKYPCRVAKICQSSIATHVARASHVEKARTPPSHPSGVGQPTAQNQEIPETLSERRGGRFLELSNDADSFGGKRMRTPWTLRTRTVQTPRDSLTLHQVSEMLIRRTWPDSEVLNCSRALWGQDRSWLWDLKFELWLREPIVPDYPPARLPVWEFVPPRRRWERLSVRMSAEFQGCKLHVILQDHKINETTLVRSCL